ncbi:TAFII28-like protein [Dacryopinax primogenitus]|uniref:TAFII28-like protein n=1 Tax=Dacryopinax primogenitus (strain DJM 731) TaxID=1858805 RepID=M5G384_DACPD|nr:TAFII28-like protein [Dacryopinax primogenitus]EJT98202.1 TAFII28-like protein [Dacryopinax primogenitus]
MDNFSQEQQTRYDWYRRSTLNKANVRKVCLIQSTGVLVTPQVAQMVAGVGKVFVGEVVERALEIQAVRGERGPLTPEDLRQAYQMYKDEKGVIGAARPLKGKRMAL